MKSKFIVSIVHDGLVLGTGKPVKSETKEYSLDEAISLTENGRFHRMIVFFSGLALMGATAENISASFILPYANCDLHLSTTEFVLFGSIPFLGIILSSHFWGFLADTWGRRKVIRLTAICSVVSSLISTLLTNIVTLITFRFIVGFFISGLQASIFSYVSEFHTKERAPRAAAIISTFMPMVFLFSSIVGIITIPLNFSLDLYFVTFVPWRLFMVILSLVNLVNAIAFCLLPESPKFLFAINETEEALAVLQSMYKMNTGESKDQYPVQRLIKESTGNTLAATKGFVNILKLVWNQTKPIFVPPYFDSTVKLCYMIFSLFAIGHGMFIWFPDFLVQLQDESNFNQTLCEIVGRRGEQSDSHDGCNVDNENTTTFMVIFFIGILFSSLSGLISFNLNRIGPRIIVPVWVTISALCSIALNFLTEFYSIVFAFIIFLSCSLCAAIVGAISVNLYPTHIRAMATCFIFMFGRLGGLVGSNVIGIFLQDNCSSIFNVFAVLSLSCVIVFLLIKKQPTEENNQNNVIP